MPDRETELWESGAAAPLLWIETAHGNVEAWALGEDALRLRRAGPLFSRSNEASVYDRLLYTA